MECTVKKFHNIHAEENEKGQTNLYVINHIYVLHCVYDFSTFKTVVISWHKKQLPYKRVPLNNIILSLLFTVILNTLYVQNIELFYKCFSYTGLELTRFYKYEVKFWQETPQYHHM